MNARPLVIHVEEIQQGSTILYACKTLPDIIKFGRVEIPAMLKLNGIKCKNFLISFNFQIHTIQYKQIHFTRYLMHIKDFELNSR